MDATVTIVAYTVRLIFVSFSCLFILLLASTVNREYFQTLSGLHTRQKLKRSERTGKICTLLIGQSHFDQSAACKSDLKTRWRRHHDSTAKKYKAVQLAGNGVTIRVFPWGNGALLWQRILPMVYEYRP